MQIRTLSGLALAGALAAVPAIAQVTEQNFRAGRTADLAALCGAPASDAMHTAAINWCHGFMIGAGQYNRSVAHDAAAHRPLFCLPTPEPTVEQARTAFVAWARSHPEFAAERAVDGLARFAAETYPCPRAETPRPRR